MNDLVGLFYPRRDAPAEEMKAIIMKLIGIDLFKAKMSRGNQTLTCSHSFTLHYINGLFGIYYILENKRNRIFIKLNDTLWLSVKY